MLHDSLRFPPLRGRGPRRVQTAVGVIPWLLVCGVLRMWVVVDLVVLVVMPPFIMPVSRYSCIESFLHRVYTFADPLILLSICPNTVK